MLIVKRLETNAQFSHFCRNLRRVHKDVSSVCAHALQNAEESTGAQMNRAFSLYAKCCHDKYVRRKNS